MKIVSIVNMKGGVGKTTISLGFSYELAQSFNKKVLLIDLDAQANVSLSILNVNRLKSVDNEQKTIADLISSNFRGLVGEKKPLNINDVIIDNPWQINKGKMDLIPSSIRLFLTKRMLKSEHYAEELLSKLLLQSQNNLDYDFCIIDCPPDFDTLVINALTASNYYLIPAEPDYLSQQGLVVLEVLINECKEHLKCKRLGIIINKIPPTRGKFHKQVIKELEEKYVNEILAKIPQKQIYSSWHNEHKPLKEKVGRGPFIEIAKRLIESD